MDEELKNAALGHLSWSHLICFITASINNKPIEYFKSVYHPRDGDDEGIRGNIFHIVAYCGNWLFLEEALQSLPEEVVHFLLCQQEETCNKGKQNPIHIAASRGHDMILRRLVDYYRRSARTVDLEPWLAQDDQKETPLHKVLEERGSQSLCLQMLSLVGVESLANVEDQHGQSPLYLAVKAGLSRVAHNILCSAVPYSLRGHSNSTALFFAPNCSDDVCSQLLRQHSELIIDKDEEGDTVLHKWVEIGKIYPFKQVLEGDFIPSRLRAEFIDQLSATNNSAENPLHVLARSNYDQSRTVEVAKILVASYERERLEALSVPEKAALPWFHKNSDGQTPLSLAMEHGNERLALFFLGLDSVYFVTENLEDDLLCRAVKEGCSQVAKQILDIVDQRGLPQLLTDCDGWTILHVAPYCTEGILRRILKNYPDLIIESDTLGRTVLHSWISIGKLWPFEHTLKRDYISTDWKRSFINLLRKHDFDGMLPLHFAADNYNTNNANDQQVIKQVVQLLLNAWGEHYSDVSTMWHFIWTHKHMSGGHIQAKVDSNSLKKFALCFLSHDLFLHLEKKELADLLFTAIENDCQSSARYILDFVEYWYTALDGGLDYLRSHGQNVLHVGWKCTVEICRLVIERWPMLIHECDNDGKTPLERASENGATQHVELILQMDHSSMIKSPLAWIGACNKRNISTVLAFAEKSPYFRNLCREKRDTPLHHLRDLSYKEYQQLLEDASIKELRNVQNSEGETPLHRAIRSENKNLTEILLTMDDVDRTIKDKNNKTAMHLLKEICDKKPEWARMCEIIEVDPTVKTTYIQVKTDLTGMRNIISLVAALLATITFTAGFAVPGGFDSNNGEPVLVTRAAFSVFLISNAYAMCCSMLILFCIIWSTVCDRNKSSLLIDRSLVLLKQSLYSTLVAFMTGVYTIIHHKSLWAAIVIIIMCSIVVISADRSIMYKVLPKLIPAAEDEYEFLPFVYFWKRRRQQKRDQDQAIPLNNQTAIQVATPLTNEDV